MGDTRKSNRWKHGVLPSSYQPDLDYRSPFMELMDKPYSEWTKKQREWFDKNVWGSTRGRPSEQIHNDLYYEMEMARLSGGATPTYRQRTIQTFELEPKAFLDYHPKTGVSTGEYKRQQLIRAYQRRKNAQRLPDPPKD